MLFYSPIRQQVVYCLPIDAPQIDEGEAIEFFRGAIEYLRSRYVKGLTEEESRRFDAATELLAYSLPDFLYAIQMGETVDESHVYNFVRMPNGTGLVVDLSKGFARGMTTSEVKAMTESGQVSALAGAESGRGTIVQDAQTAAETTTMTVEEILVAMLESLCDWIDERPEARAKGWIPRRPSAGSGHPLSDISRGP